MADMVTKQELEAAKIDVKHAGEAVNEEKVVKTRLGRSFKSIPLIVREGEAKITQAAQTITSATASIVAQKNQASAAISEAESDVSMAAASVHQRGNQEIANLQNAINIAAAAGAGENGWTDSLVLMANGELLTTYMEALERSKKEKDAHVSILDFCKCDGTDESAKALLAVNRANSQRVPLNIPSNAELLINGSTTLEPIYGLFGGGRIRRSKTGWTTNNPFVLINNKNQYVDNIIFLKHNVAYDEIDNVQLTEQTPTSGFIEVTKNAKNYKITHNTFRGGRFCNWIYGGEGGLVFENDSDVTQEAFIYFGCTDTYTRPEELKGISESVVVAMNKVRRVSNASIGGTTGDGVKTTANCKNIVFIANDIQYCRGDAIDLFSSGESIIIQGGNILANNGVKGVDIKSGYTDFPIEQYGRNQQIIVEGNHIFGNAQQGVAVSNTGDTVPMVKITGNNIYKNGYGGILYRGQHGLIKDNFIYANATYASSYNSGIRLETSGVMGELTRYIDVVGNRCFNNGNSDNTNNCGIVVMSGVSDCILHENQCHNLALPGLENSGMQNYGLFIQADTAEISFDGNKASGNITQNVGWSAGAGLVGRVLTQFVGDISAARTIPMAAKLKNFGVVSVSVQSMPYPANADNHFIFRVRAINEALAQKMVLAETITTKTTALNLFGAKFNAPVNANSDHALFVLVDPVGTPAPISGLSVSLNIVEW